MCCAQVAQSASAVSQAMADASAKLQRSQRFGSSLQEIHVPAEPGSTQAASPSAPAFAAFRGPATFRQASPEPMADDAEAEAGPGTMDEDSALPTCLLFCGSNSETLLEIEIVPMGPVGLAHGASVQNNGDPVWMRRWRNSAGHNPRKLHGHVSSV